ncbi:MAG: AbrB/MazE/SpoVT family DNA-binding domain-containing protein [Armatimonadota bacterium]
MASLVGTKGQVVIDGAIRRQLGIEAGWRAIQQLVGDRVLIEFIPPPHEESLCGILAPHATRKPSLGENWESAADSAAAADWAEPKMGSGEMSTVEVPRIVRG